jgi:sugar phosphate isomerase/epimerase
VFVACSTACFTKYPLERALKTIAELEFNKLEVVIDEKGPHLRPSEVVENLVTAAHRVRFGPGLAPAAITAELGCDRSEKFEKELRAVCHLARLAHASLVTLPSASAGSDLDAEVERLADLVRVGDEEGAVICVETRAGTLTELPDAAVELCRRVPGLGLTLDPSHFIAGPHQGRNFDVVYPFVRHVQLRDTARAGSQFQVRVGQGNVEYGRIITQLTRHQYKRLLAVEIYDIPDAPWVIEHEVRKLKYLLESLV